MATYTNETSLKIKKSDLVIYIVALIAFILMIVVLMSDKIGITKRSTSIINNETAYTNTTSNTNTNSTEQRVSGHQETVSNNEHGTQSQANQNQSETNTSDQNVAVSPLNRELLNDLQRNSMRTNSPAQADQATSETSNSENAEQIDRQHTIVERNTAPVITPSNNNQIAAISNRNSSSTQIILPQNNIVSVERNTSINNRPNTNKIIQEPNVQQNSDNRAVVQENTSIVNDAGLKVIEKIQTKFGDTLWRIALRYNVKTINIIKVNNLTNPNLIYPGQSINIPNK